MPDVLHVDNLSGYVGAARAELIQHALKLGVEIRYALGPPYKVTLVDEQTGEAQAYHVLAPSRKRAEAEALVRWGNAGRGFHVVGDTYRDGGWCLRNPEEALEGTV